MAKPSATSCPDVRALFDQFEARKAAGKNKFNWVKLDKWAAKWTPRLEECDAEQSALEQAAAELDAIEQQTRDSGDQADLALTTFGATTTRYMMYIGGGVILLLLAMVALWWYWQQPTADEVDLLDGGTPSAETPGILELADAA